MSLRAVTATALAVAAASAWLLPAPLGARAPGVGPDLEPVADTSWRQVLAQAVAASSDMAYEASMVVVSLGPDGPGVTEVVVRHRPDGGLTMSSSESWLIARDQSSAVFLSDEVGQPLRLHQVQPLPFTLPQVARTYEIRVLGRAELRTGSALAVGFRRHGLLRERLFVDERTGLVVRRETFDLQGSPVRVTALTSLDVDDRTSASPGTDVVPGDGDGTGALGGRTRLGPDEVLAMPGHGWDVPTTVAQVFDLRAGFAVDGGDAVQLVYSDGLYSLSLLEQPGSVDGDALQGAVYEQRAGIPLYRWPGAEPERIVWNGDGHAFTAVTDAPLDVLMAAVADLPHDRVPSLTTRMGRGLSRVARWLWPFD